MERANSPTSFWGDYILVAMHILNRSLTKASGKTPYELLIGKS